MINEDKLIFLSWNAIEYKQCTKEEFTDFFLWVDADFFSLQFSKKDRFEIPPIFEGYYVFWNSSNIKSYSKSLIYTKHKPISVSYGLSNKVYNDEGRLITLEYNDFYLVNSYPPNVKRDLRGMYYRMGYENRVQQYYKSLMKFKPIILCGDLNVVYSKISSSLKNNKEAKAGHTFEEREKFKELLDIGFIDSFEFINSKKNMNTIRINPNNSGNHNRHKSDYFLVDDTLYCYILNSDIFDIELGSNHYPIMLEMSYSFLSN